LLLIQLSSNWTSCHTIQGVIISITKLLIVIGSPCTYLSRNQHVITWVSSITGIQFELYIIEYLWLDALMICMSIMRALTASFTMFPTVLKTYEKQYRCFHSKEVLRRHFYFWNSVFTQRNFSNFSDFEINCPITPWIVLHSVELLLLNLFVIHFHWLSFICSIVVQRKRYIS